MTPEIPLYLEKLYWWAYARTWAILFWDHQLMVEGILLGNYGRLRNAALEEFGMDISGRTLQVGCCYGNLTPYLLERIAHSGGTLDVVDVLPMQLKNLRGKVPWGAPIRMLLMDAAALDIPDASYDRVLLFFLLHEQPQAYREQTLSEALRVLKPGGTIVIIDYGRPAWWHPARFSTLVLYAWLKPPAVDVWNRGLADVIPGPMAGRTWHKTSYFGGLFQKFVSSG